MCMYHNAEKDAIFQAQIRALNGGETLGSELVRLREQTEKLRAELNELVGLLADVKRIAESGHVYSARRIIDICDAVADVAERHDGFATGIESLRMLSPIGDWFRPYARSTYRRMTKEDIIDHLGVAFHNWYLTEQMLGRATERARMALSGGVKLEDS